MLGSMALQQIGFGLVLIVAFSAGLAGTLIAVGLLMVYSGRAAGRMRLAERLGGSSPRLARLVRFAPVASAAVVALLGLGLTYEALLDLKVPLALAADSLRGMAPLALACLVAGAAIGLGLRSGRHVDTHGAGDAGLDHAHDHDHGHGGHTHAPALVHAVYAGDRARNQDAGGDGESRVRERHAAPTFGEAA
jgi:hypothetical protein